MKKDSEVIKTVADQCLVTPKVVKEILGKIRDSIYSDLVDTGKTRVPLLGLVIQTRVKKPTPARMGKNPFTGEDRMIAAKPAKRVIRARMTAKHKSGVLSEIERLYGIPEMPEIPPTK